MSVNKLSGLVSMQTRLDNRGGSFQQDRMIADKRRTLDKVVNYSYQGATVKRVGAIETARALINPNQLKQDYDDKILSIGFEHGYQIGDVFEWVNTGTKWLIYLQETTELAYFRGNVRKCSYEISWRDDDGKIHTTYAAVKGPEQEGIQSIQRAGASIDIPNYTLNLLLPNHDHVREYFQRYSKFYLKGTSKNEASVCWRVEAVNAYSNPGILEIFAHEYYANVMEDDLEKGIVGGLIVNDPTVEVVSAIEGETFIKPKKTYTYTYSGNESAGWLFDTSLPIETEIKGTTITIKWLNTYSGQFVLQYGSAQKTIVVESLF